MLAQRSDKVSIKIIDIFYFCIDIIYMNLQQLEYIVAVDNYGQFLKAAEKCFVTQATLSMMIRKFEEELGVRIFDRSRQPVVATETGRKVIAEARTILLHTERLRELVSEEVNELKGDLRVGIIPTLAPYLLPLFLNDFLSKFSNVHMHIFELTTHDLVEKLEKRELDAGLLATPLGNPHLNEFTLFYEEFMVYASEQDRIIKKKYLMAEDIDINQLWLLEEGHCFRSQIINLCELHKKEMHLRQLDLAVGSIETLKNLVDTYKGITIIPALAMNNMTARQKKHIRFFHAPAPVREISLVTHRFFVKEKLLQALIREIQSNIPDSMRKLRQRDVIHF